jgi:hypothetical protein
MAYFGKGTRALPKGAVPQSVSLAFECQLRMLMPDSNQLGDYWKGHTDPNNNVPLFVEDIGDRRFARGSGVSSGKHDLQRVPTRIY